MKTSFNFAQLKPENYDFASKSVKIQPRCSFFSLFISEVFLYFLYISKVNKKNCAVGMSIMSLGYEFFGYACGCLINGVILQAFFVADGSGGGDVESEDDGHYRFDGFLVLGGLNVVGTMIALGLLYRVKSGRAAQDLSEEADV